MMCQVTSIFLRRWKSHDSSALAILDSDRAAVVHSRASAYDMTSNASSFIPSELLLAGLFSPYMTDPFRSTFSNSYQIHPSTTLAVDSTPFSLPQSNSNSNSSLIPLPSSQPLFNLRLDQNSHPIYIRPTQATSRVHQ